MTRASVSTALAGFVLFRALAWASDMQGSAPECHPTQGTVTQTSNAPAVKVSKPSEDVWPPQVNVPSTESDRVTAKGEHEKTVLFKNIRVQGIYKSMRGPWTRKYVRLDPGDRGAHTWVTRYRAEVLDGITGTASQEFMCHTNMDLAGGPGTPQAFQRIRSELSISQGQKEVAFPKGYALRVDNNPATQMDVNVMVLNNNYPDMDKPLDFKVTIGYVGDAQASAHKLVPLTESAVSINCTTEAGPMNGGDTLCEPASKFLVSSGGDKRTGHWLIPPGRHEYRNHLGQSIGLASHETIHYIWMHIHPYAESMELFDRTSGKSVWKGAVKNDPQKAIVLETEYYSSSQGIHLPPGHDYDLISTYNNRTDHKIDAMAALWMYSSGS